MTLTGDIGCEYGGGQMANPGRSLTRLHPINAAAPALQFSLAQPVARRGLAGREAECPLHLLGLLAERRLFEVSRTDYLSSLSPLERQRRFAVDRPGFPAKDLNSQHFGVLSKPGNGRISGSFSAHNRGVYSQTINKAQHSPAVPLHELQE